MENGDIVNDLSDLEYKGYYINPIVFFGIGDANNKNESVIEKAIEKMK